MLRRFNSYAYVYAYAYVAVWTSLNEGSPEQKK